MSLISKIHAVRLKGLTVVKKGKTNLGLFASYVDVWSELQPHLEREGLSIGFSGARIVINGDSEIVTMDMTISDGVESVTWSFDMIVPERIISGSSGKSVTNNAQRVASAESYLRRTAMIHAFGMSAGNEDECERMQPVGDQTNIPGAVPLPEGAAWQDYVDNAWEPLLSPLHDGKLVDYAKDGPAAMGTLWKEFPGHAGLQAWAHDWMLSTMRDFDITWANITSREPGLPEWITGCNADQLRTAAAAVKAIRQERTGK